MNLSQLQSEIGRLLNDPSNQRWTSDVLTTRINLAMTEIQGFSNAVRTSENLIPSSNVDLDADTMNVVRVKKRMVNGDTFPLLGITSDELDFRYPGWAQWSAGDPLFWYYEASRQLLFLVPTPDASVISQITVYESRKPADLVNSTDIPFDSNNQMIPYHTSIVHWVVAQCWMDDGTPESLAKAKFHKSGDMNRPGQYELQLARIIAEFDVEEAVPSHIMFQPQGGRLGGVFNIPSKSFPLGF